MVKRQLIGYAANSHATDNFTVRTDNYSLQSLTLSAATKNVEF